MCMPYLGTKRPSDGADMRAFRGARCRDRSPLSLQQKKENYFTLKILCNKSIFQENKTPMTPPSQPECTTEIQWFLCFRCSKFIQVTAKSSWQFYIRVTSKSSFFTAWQCLKSINKTTESMNQCQHLSKRKRNLRIFIRRAKGKLTPLLRRTFC